MRIKRKKRILAALCLVAAGITITSCSSDDNNREKTQNFSHQLYGKKWVMDGNKSTSFRFFHNHLVECNGGTSTASGALTGGDALFFGTWTTTDTKLTTTFTSGTNGGFDWNNILYGTLTLKKIADNDRLLFISADNTKHELLHISSYTQSNTFTDYTDDTDHDKALQGTWHATAYIDNQAVEYTITVGKDGTVRWQQADHGIDFTSQYTTSNGHVMVNHFLVPNSDKASYIYIREDDRILFYTEDDAQLEWNWRK